MAKETTIDDGNSRCVVEFQMLAKKFNFYVFTDHFDV